MKTKTLILTLLLGSAAPLVAWGQSTNTVPPSVPAATTKQILTASQVDQTQTKMVHVAYPLTLTKADLTKTQTSDQPIAQSWSQIAFQQADQDSSSFSDLKTHHVVLDLFWIGAEPHH